MEQATPCFPIGFWKAGSGCVLWRNLQKMKDADPELRPSPCLSKVTICPRWNPAFVLRLRLQLGDPECKKSDDGKRINAQLGRGLFFFPCSLPVNSPIMPWSGELPTHPKSHCVPGQVESIWKGLPFAQEPAGPENCSVGTI